MKLPNGRTAIGGRRAQGIGLAIAHAFVDQGARVAIGDLDPAANKCAIVELGGETGTPVVRDLPEADRVEALVRQAVDALVRWMR